MTQVETVRAFFQQATQNAPLPPGACIGQALYSMSQDPRS